MAHSGISIDHSINEELMDILSEALFENENNAWPDGMMREDDEGVLPLGIGIENGRVKMRFAKEVNWIGFTPDQAIQVAEILVKNAKKASEVIEMKL